MFATLSPGVSMLEHSRGRNQKVTELHFRCFFFLKNHDCVGLDSRNTTSDETCRTKIASSKMWLVG